MRLLFAVFFVASVASVPSVPSVAAGRGDVGTTTAPFLKLAPDPRAAGMGEAFAAVADEASAVYFDPAGLATLDHASVQVSQSFYLSNISYQYLGYAQPVAALFHESPKGLLLPESEPKPDWGSLGFSLLYVNEGSIDQFDKTGAPSGSFAPSDLAFTGAYGFRADPFDLGLAAKYLQSKISNSASTVAADAAVRWHSTLYERPWTVSAGFRNLGGTLKYVNESDPLPASFVLGNALRPADAVLVALDITVPNDNAPYFALGVESTGQLSGGMRGDLRLGYSTRDSNSGLNGFAGASLGAGLTLSFCRIDYAWVPFGLLGDTHRVGLTFRF